MFRSALTYLKNSWINIPDRKPLVLRGARQVGKTWIARAFAKETGLKLIEINFERNPELKSLFEPNDPRLILQNLEAYKGIKIDPASSLLFLDEIQDASDLLPKLRWFYEELPKLAVITAGSLLEFILSDHTFSMPVGRVSYLYVEPFSFDEFLLALGEDNLLDYISNISPPFNIPQAIHHKLQEIHKLYTYVGGMPACVSKWVTTKSLQDVIPIQEDLLSTYRDDFFKYKGRLDVTKLHAVMNSIPHQLSEKFTYAKVDSSIQAASTKQVLTLLNNARICHKIKNTSANGMPLAAEIKDKAFKEIFLDIGLVQRLISNNFNHAKTIVEGPLAEQVVGQMLRTFFPPYKDPELFYWQRDESGSNAEIDYLIEHNGEVVPIEVKSGSTGSLKSLHLFMEIKKREFAVRVNNDQPSLTNVSIKGRNNQVHYTLLSLPFYLLTQLQRILDQADNRVFHIDDPSSNS